MVAGAAGHGWVGRAGCTVVLAGMDADGGCGWAVRELQSAIRTKEGLPEMLEQARREEPLDGWGGIKVATQDDLKP